MTLDDNPARLVGSFEKERVRGFGRRGKQEMVSPSPETFDR